MNSTVCEGEYPVVDLPPEALHKPLHDSKETFEILKKFGEGETEVAIMITIDENDCIISMRIVSIGGRGETTMSICDMLRSAITDKAAGIIVAHNHPGGECTPSGNDEEFVKDLQSACNTVGIDLIDSLIISKDKYQSMFAKRIGGVKKTREYLGSACTALSDLGSIMQTVGGVVLSIFVVSWYIAVSKGEPLPQLNPVVIIILVMYPLSWALKTLTKFAETIVTE